MVSLPFKPSLKLEAVFEQLQVHEERLRTRRLDFRDDHTQLETLACGAPGSGEFLDRADRYRFAVSGFLSDARQVGSGRRRRRKSANRQQTLIVEDDVNQIPGRIPGERAERSKIHQQGSVAVQDDHPLVGFRKRESKPHRRSETHCVLQIEEVFPVAKRVKLRSDCAHDRDDDVVFDVGVKSAYRVDSLHHASHMSCRESSSATGVSDDSASACASPICRSTSAGFVKWSYGMSSAFSTGSVKRPPCVCQGVALPHVAAITDDHE